MKDKCVAIVLAGGSGKRIGGNVPKQYIEINGKPLIYYCLKTFEESFIDEIVLVVRAGDEEYVRKEIVDRYSFKKVVKITAGGEERYSSVACGLEAIENCDYVFIHDGARAFVTGEVLQNAHEAVKKYGATVASVKSKDTVKLADKTGFVSSTPDRDSVYIMQTPQVFDFAAIRECYRKLLASEKELLAKGINITDDAMVMERFGSLKVFLCRGDYKNIKVTTPEDVNIAKMILK